MKLGKPYTDVDGKMYQNVVSWDMWETTPPGCQVLNVPDCGNPHWATEHISGPVLKRHYRIPYSPPPTWEDVWAACDNTLAVKSYGSISRTIKFDSPTTALEAIKAVSE